MPACHGSGGLAGQYRFGARSGSSIIFLGLIKFLFGLIALFNSEPIVTVLSGIPKSLLGVLVLAAGIELAKVGETVNTDARDLRIVGHNSPWDGKSLKELEDSEKKERWMVMLVTVAALLAFRNDAVGFVAGLVWFWGYRVSKRTVEWRERRRGGAFWRSFAHRPEEGTGLLSHEESDTVA
jgi:hypothetical protein